jgi:ADP-ribose pyrophosphatase
MLMFDISTIQNPCIFDLTENLGHMQHWKILQQEDIFKNHWYHLRKDVVQLPNEQIIDDYFVSVRPEVALVFAITENQKVLLVKQYKHGIQQVVIELPGGFFDKKNEPAKNAALRELQEETGYTTDSIDYLGKLSDNPTKDTNSIHLFIAKNCKHTSFQNLDSTEFIEVLEVDLNQIKKLVLNREIHISSSVATIFMALEHLQIR